MSKRVFIVLVLIALALVAVLPLQAQEESGSQTDTGSLVVFPELFNRAVEAAGAGDYDQAIIDYTLFLLVNPTFSQAYFNRALNYQALGDTRLAFQDMGQALAYQQPSPQYTATVYFSRANMHLDQNDLSAALDDLDAAIEVYPEGVDSHRVRARILSFQERFDDALEDYDALITLEPDVAVHHIERGYINSQLGNLEAALADYTDAISLSPDDPQVYAERAFFYAATRNFENALEDINSAIDLSPQNSNFYLLRGSLNTQAENTLDAASDYLQWLTLNQTERYTTDRALTGNQQFVVEMGPGVTYAIPFRASSGQSLSVTANSRSETPVDPLLVVLDIHDEPLVADDDSAGNMDAAIIGYVLPEDGEYTLVIGHAGGHAGEPGDVLVRLALANGD